LRRGALLRTAPENLSAQQKEELRRLCLENPADNGTPTLVDASRLIGNIPANVTVLVYFVGSRTWVWRLERNVAPSVIPLGAPRDFNLTIARFLRKFAGPDSIGGWEADSDRLYTGLVQPAGKIRAGQVLAIAGAGYFPGLPFDALGPSGGKLLGEQHPIVYVEDLLAEPPSVQMLPRRAAIVGSGGLSSNQAENEATDIAKLLGVAALVGSSATRARVSQELNAANWIHFSTHGVIDKFNSYRSYLALSDNERIQGFELPAMAGSAAMITFSACDSNVSFIPLGSSSQPGFAHGLAMFAHAAGAQWVVSSLWKADQDASRKLMVAYYRQLRGGQSPVMALFNAKSQYLDRETEHTRKAPWFWAGYAVSSLTLAGLAVP
jgi:CHAT domain-containing protein